MPRICYIVPVAFFGLWVAGCSPAPSSGRNDPPGSPTAAIQGEKLPEQGEPRATQKESSGQAGADTARVQPGADCLNEYLPLLRGKTVGLVVNHTSVAGNTHLADTLQALGITIGKIFSPEHGFRGNAPAGDSIANDVDAKTGIPIISLYGSHYKPTPADLSGLDIVVFDIQDVGTRFYTYTSTMAYAMEACAENNLPYVVLDRPNPLGNIVDGPVLQPGQKSFVGLFPIPIAYGLTMGELAGMINGEGWLKNGVKADLYVIRLKNWNYETPYSLPIAPSPNLRTNHAVAWYPSICLFEGTIMSVGRGTLFPFEVLGYPSPGFGEFQFTPKPIRGMSDNPRHKGKLCYGIDLRQVPAPHSVDLTHLISLFGKTPKGKKFFNDYFDLLAGTPELRRQIEKGLSQEEIKASWQADLQAYRQLRKKYLLYPNAE